MRGCDRKMCTYQCSGCPDVIYDGEEEEEDLSNMELAEEGLVEALDIARKLLVPMDASQMRLHLYALRQVLDNVSDNVEAEWDEWQE